MKQFNYKCVVAKNGTKMYYKRVKNKWKRISNSLGMKAEKGKRKYMMTKEQCEKKRNMKWVNGKCVEKTREEIRRSLLSSMKFLKDDDVRRVLFKKCLTNIGKYEEYLEMDTEDFHNLFLDENLTDKKLDMLIDIQKCRGEGKTSEGINEDTEYGPLLMYIFSGEVEIPPIDTLFKIIDKLKDTEYDINFQNSYTDQVFDQTLLTLVLKNDDINEEDKLKIVEKILSSFPNLNNVLNIQDRNEKQTDFWGNIIENIKPTYFLNIQDEQGDTLLFSKYMISTPALFKKLLDMDFNKIDLNIKNDEGHTLIEDVLQKDEFDLDDMEAYLLELVKRNTFDINKLYDVNIDRNNYTLLMLAALLDWRDLATELLKNPNIRVDKENKLDKSAHFFTYGDYMSLFEKEMDGSDNVRELLKEYCKRKKISRDWYIGFWENNDTDGDLEDAMGLEYGDFDKDKCRYEDWDFNESCEL